MRFPSSLETYFTEISAAAFCILAIAFSFGCGRNTSNVSVAAGEKISPVSHAININTASKEELQTIPHVGEKLAKKIIEHREKHGPFRKAEHLMLISGISDKRFRKIRPVVRVE